MQTLLVYFFCCNWGSHWYLLVLPETAEEISPDCANQCLSRKWSDGIPQMVPPSCPGICWHGEKSQSHTAMRLPELGHLLQLDSSCQLCLPASVSFGRDAELLAWMGRRVFPLDAYYWQGSWLTLLCQLCQASLVFSEKVPLDLREKWTYLGFLLLPSWGSDNTRYEWSSVEAGIWDVLPL